MTPYRLPNFWFGNQLAATLEALLTPVPEHVHQAVLRQIPPCIPYSTCGDFPSLGGDFLARAFYLRLGVYLCWCSNRLRVQQSLVFEASQSYSRLGEHFLHSSSRVSAPI